MQSGIKLCFQDCIYHPLRFDKFLPFKRFGHDHHFEVCLRSLGYIVHVALIYHLEVGGLEGGHQLRFDGGMPRRDSLGLKVEDCLGPGLALATVIFGNTRQGLVDV